MIDTLKKWSGFIVFVVGATLAIESRYMKALDASEQHKKLEAAIATKTEKSDVEQFRVIYIEEQIDELKFRYFQVKKKPNLDSDDEYEIQYIERRIEKLQQLIRE